MREHAFVILYGIGANGKSTFLNTLSAMFGDDYAMKAPPELLMVKRGEAHPTERADLFGKRLVSCIETEDGRRLAESLVKEMSGGDKSEPGDCTKTFPECADAYALVGRQP